MPPTYSRPDELVLLDEDDSTNVDTMMPDVAEENDRAIAMALQEAEYDEDGSNPINKSLRTQVTRDRNVHRPPIAFTDYDVLDSCQNLMELRVTLGDTVELNYGEERPADINKMPSGDFLRIFQILQKRHTGDITLRGILFRRTKYLKGIFPSKMNELCMIMDSSNEPATIASGMVEKPLGLVVQKRELRLTNHEFPRLSYRSNSSLQNLTPRDIFYNEALICRWCYIGEDPSLGRPRPGSGRVIKRLTKQQCQPILQPQDRFFSAEELRHISQEETHPRDSAQTDRDIVRQFEDGVAEIRREDFEACLHGRSPSTAIDIDEEVEKDKFEDIIASQVFTTKTMRKNGRSLSNAIDVEQHQEDRSEVIVIQDRPIKAQPTTKSAGCQRSQHRNYSFGDTFSGAGGASEGASAAGLNIELAVDKDRNCVIVYRGNHPGTAIHELEIDQFLQAYARHVIVDILHISPPCQYFSVAHTHDGSDDAANIAALFSVHGLLETMRPRIVTLEQTWGIEARYEQTFFHALLGMFIANNYDIRAKVIRFADFGSCQMRKRLIIFAARAGEELPSFPEPTHDKYGENGLPRHRTARDFIREIQNLPRGPLHEPESMIVPDDWKPMDARQLNGQLPTVCTGGRFFHPVLPRELTLLEFAVLQGFPVEYNWAGVTRSTIRKQIGNAVPPNVFKIFYEHIIKHLERVDNEREAIELLD